MEIGKKTVRITPIVRITPTVRITLTVHKMDFFDKLDFPRLDYLYFMFGYGSCVRRYKEDTIGLIRTVFLSSSIVRITPTPLYIE